MKVIITPGLINIDAAETLEYITHLGVLSESFPMNTNMSRYRWFSEILMSKENCDISCNPEEIFQLKCKCFKLRVL